MAFNEILKIAGLITVSVLATWILMPVKNTASEPVIREVERIIYEERIVHPSLVEFPSRQVLDEWCRTNIAVLLIPDADGIIRLNGRKSSSLNDCDDYADRLQRLAADDGYLMSVTLVLNGQITGFKVSNVAELHMGNLAMVGDDIYYIEPQPFDYHITLIVQRD
jgi:hypothetical protein